MPITIRPAPRTARCLLPLTLAGLWVILGAVSVHAGELVTPAERALLADRVAFASEADPRSFSRFIVHHRKAPLVAAAAGAGGAAAAPARQLLAGDLERIADRFGIRGRALRSLATGGELIRLEEGRRLDASEANLFMAELARNPEVIAVEPDLRVHAQFVPNDTYYSVQWALKAGAGGINAQAAWDESTGADVTIAILDTGTTAHPDLDPQLLAGYDFISDEESARDGDGRDDDPSDEGDWHEEGDCPDSAEEERESSWHGTHVAGIAAAATNNNRGVAGVAPDARILPVRVLGRCGGWTSDIVEGIVWAAGGSVTGVPANTNPARVINLSLGGEGACTLSYRNAITHARELGAIVIASAGNEGEDTATFVPASCPGVIAVAATGNSGTRAPYSNHGTRVDLAAPGGNLTSEKPENGIASTFNFGAQEPEEAGYAYMNGTSMAAPHVAGVAALMLERNPDLAVDELAALLRDTARPFPAGCSNGCGTGILDALAAVRAAGGTPIAQFPLAVTPLGSGEGTVTSTPAGIDCGANCATRFAAGTTVTLKAKPAPGTAFEGWSGACSGTGDCTLTADRGIAVNARFSVPSNRLTSPTVLEDLSASGSGRSMYRLTVPSGSTALIVRTSGGTGDADLYVRHGAEPTLETWDCRPWKVGNNESCIFAAPMAGVYYIMLASDPSYAGVKLEARYTGGPLGGRTLKSGVPMEGFTAQQGGARYFRINVPASASRLRIRTWEESDLDLYVRQGGTGGGVPTLGNFDWVSGEWDGNEEVIIEDPAPGFFFIMMHAYDAYQSASIVATYTNLDIDYAGSGAGGVRLKRAFAPEEATPCTSLPCAATLKNASYDLVAVPATGSRFAGWKPAECDSIVAGNCRLQPRTARNVTATFTATATNSPVLTIGNSGSGSGTVSVQPVSGSSGETACDEFPCRPATAGGSMDLVAEPAPGSRFAGWNGAGCDSRPAPDTCRVTVNRSRQAEVSFQPLR